MSEKVLPTNWAYSTMDLCLSFIRGVSFPKDAKSLHFAEGKVACLRTANVQKEVDWDDLWFIDKSRVKRNEQFVKLGDILISTANSLELLGKSSLVKSLPYESTLGTFIVNLRVNSLLNNKFIYYYLNTFPFLSEVRKQGSTTTNISNISVGKLEKFELPIAPLNEQHRIVEKIEELFSKLDAAQKELKNVKLQLKRYRQSVLKSAFEGKLTEGTKIEWVTLGDVCKDFQYGSSKKSIMEGKVAVIRMGNIQNSKIDWNDLKFTNDDAEIEKYKLNHNDVLFNRTNSPELVGKTCIYKSEQNAIFAGYLIRINYDRDSISGDYLNYYLNSSKARAHGSLVQSFGVNQSNINASKLKDYPFPNCVINEQQKIVEEIETRFSVADKIEEEIDRNLKKTEQLRQSILKQAFQGKLVPQDPNDPPASELLEAIKKERKKIEK